MAKARAVLPLLLAAVSCAKIVVKPVTPNMGGEGVFYALPNTVLRVQLKADMKKVTDAPFSQYTAIFVPDGEKVCDTTCTKSSDGGAPSKTVYSIQQGATFATYGEPDTSNVYFVQFSGKATVDQALTMAWTESGVLSSTSSTVTNRATDVAMAGIKLIGSLGTKGFYGGAEFHLAADATCSLAEEESVNDKWIVPILGTLGAGVVANYCALPKKTRESFSQATHEKPLKRAVAAYAISISPLLVARAAALQSRPGVDPLPLLTKLDAMIQQQFEALFLGTTATKTWEGTFDVREFQPSTPVTLFGIDPHHGLCIGNAPLAADAKPFPSGFVTDACTTTLPVQLSVKLYPDAKQQLFTSVKAAGLETKGERGFRYRVPAQVQASVSGTTKDGKGVTKEVTYGTGVLTVAQFGTVAALPAKRNAKTLTYELAMIEATGGLKSFKLGTTGGLDAATVDALSGAGGTVLDARNAARKQAKTDADEVTVLTREQTLLKLKDEICELQKKYGQACTVQP
jgi:hypothetical protein